MGGDDDSDDDDGGLALPESMLQSTVNFAFENGKKHGGAHGLNESYDESKSNSKSHKNVRIESPTISNKHKFAESKEVSRAGSIVQKVVKTVEYPNETNEKNGTLNSQKPNN